MTTSHPGTIVFDLDGTLLDTLADIGESANIVLARHAWPTHAIDDYRRFIGRGVTELMRRAAPAELAEETLAACVQEFAEVYREHWHQQSRPYDGVPTLLRRVCETGWRLAVLSNKPQAFTVECVKHYFPASPFEVVFGQRAGVPVKPDPAALVEILELLSTPPRQAVMLGDSAVDIATARAAGVTGVGAGWGFRGAAELMAAGAARVIERPEQLADLLADRGGEV